VQLENNLKWVRIFWNILVKASPTKKMYV